MKFLLLNLVTLLQKLRDNKYGSDCETNLINNETSSTPVKDMLPTKWKEVFDTGSFTLDLGCGKAVNTFKLLNAQKDFWTNRSTKEFKIYMRESLLKQITNFHSCVL